MTAYAQRIQVVDSDGLGIPLVTVLNEDGNMIGATNLDGVFDNLKGAAKVTLTHVAFKPQTVIVADFTDGRITMEDNNYNLAEIVVKPKPYIYVETYYRAYVYRNDSLIYFKCGIMPNTYDPKKTTFDYGSSEKAYVEFAPTMGIAINWGVRVDVSGHAGKLTMNGFPSDEAFRDKYMVETTEQGPNRKTYSNEEGVVGSFVNNGNQARMTLDAGKMQMYANKAEGQTKLLKQREEKGYKYKFTLIHNCSDEMNYDPTNFAMRSDHWEYDDKKSHVTMVVETYASDHGYMDKDDFKAKKQEIKNNYKGATLQSLEAYATAHNIPAISPIMLQAVQKLKRW